ncbi:MAG: bZIP transcription factor [Bacteroidota bacterium]|nr:bZIP transcription factor [Bacteroidota bacterium]
MKTYIASLVIGLLMINTLSGQVKIGDNPQNLDPASVLELESNNRVLVITRVTNAQMSTINPLPGAMVYNTDQGCINYFNGTEWINICEALDNSFTVSTRADSLIQVNPNAIDNTITILQSLNPDGSTNYNFEVNQITGVNIVNSTINGDTKIQTASVTKRLLAPESVSLGKFENGTQAGQIFRYNGTAWTLSNEKTLAITEKDSVIGNEVVGPTLGGSLELFGAGLDTDPFTLDVLDGGIDNTELAPDAVTTDKIFNGAIITEDLADDAVTLSKMADNSVGTIELVDDSVDADKINANVAGTGLIQAGDGSLQVDVTQFAGDGTLSSTDGTILITGTPTNALFEDVQLDVADNAITSAKILDGAIATADIADLAITNAKLGGGSVSTGKIGDGAVTSLKIANGEVATIDLADNAVTLAKMADNSVGTIELTDDSVTADKINANVAGTGLTQAGDGSLQVDNANITPDWTSITNIPAGFADDIDDDTTYSAGTGLTLTGTTFAVDNATISPDWSTLTGVPAGFADDIDDDTTYSAGTGLTLTGTTFAVDNLLGDVTGPTSATVIANDAVTSAKIADGTITNDDIQLGAGIDGSKVNPIFVSDVSTTGDFISGGTILNVPDFVFQKYFSGFSELNNSYRFKSLKEVEEFVKKNNHLPGIRSAYEIKASGKYRLTESSLAQLEKIEELFLHTIEQEKKIEKLQSENEKLASEVNNLKAEMEKIKALLLEQKQN